MALSPNVKTLMKAVKQAYRVETFIETGTYKGETALWAAQQYQQVITCEASFEIFHQAHETFSEYDNIDHRYGHSLETLQKILSDLSGPAIYWIDSHWSVEQTYGENDECPLLDELQIILTHSSESFLFVDDARYFCTPPPRPHNPKAWPNLQEIFEVVNNLSDAYLTLYEDCIVIVPAEAKDILMNEYQRLSQSAPIPTRKWWQLLLRG